MDRPFSGPPFAGGSSPDAASFDWSDPATYAATRQPIDRASTLPGSVYHDNALYDLETTNVWRSSWVVAGELTEVAEHGDVMPAQIGNQNIILVNDKGTIRAFHNVCRHRGAQLVEERCTKRRTILCPYHRWGYALDGRLMATPSWDGDETGKAVPEKLRKKFTSYVKDFEKKEMGLYPVRVDTSLGLVFVNLNGEAPPLSEWLGDLVPALEQYTPTLNGAITPAHKKTYDVAANWKLIIENFLEYYHLPAVHPDLCDVSGVDEHMRRQGKGMYMCFVTSPLNGDSTSAPTPLDPGRLPSFPDLRGENLQTAWHICLFPNVFFSLYPDHFFRVVLSPRGPHRTMESSTLCTHKDSPMANAEAPDVLEGMRKFWDNVNLEDIDIVEKTQRGTSALPYKGGRFSFRFEEPLHRFQNMVIDKVLGEESERYRIPSESAYW
jgi:choline monooxygenase